jgi:hypothetical protein
MTIQDTLFLLSDISQQPNGELVLSIRKERRGSRQFQENVSTPFEIFAPDIHKMAMFYFSCRVVPPDSLCNLTICNFIIGSKAQSYTFK